MHHAYFGFLRNIVLVGRFIAKTLYGEEDEEEISQNDTLLEEPKLLGTHPESGKKVSDKKTYA